MRFINRAIFAVVALALSAAQAQAQQAPRDTLLVFDASGSMWGQIGGRAKIEIAREAIAGVLGRIDPKSRVGMIAYGHRRPADCKDVELVAPLAPFDKAKLEGAVAKLTPRGKTPITEALRQAAAALPNGGGTVLLVTDGIETCNADPCALAAELKKRNVNFVTHVVGFDVGNRADQAKIACIATRTGGLFVAAKDAASLGDALARTVAARPQPVAAQRSIPLRATDGPNGPSIGNAVFSIMRTADQTAVAENQSGAIDLAPGRYTVSALAGTRTGSVAVDVTASAPKEIVVPVTGSLPPAAVRPASPSITAGAIAQVAWEGPNRRGDYLAIVAADGSELETRHYAYTSDGSPAKLRMPGTPGRYEIRYMLGDPYVKLAAAPITVVEARASLTAPASAPAGGKVEVRWQGPGSEDDWVALARRGAQPSDYITYAYTNSGNPVRLDVPVEPGAYELRYVMATDTIVLASLPLAVAAAGATLTAPERVGGGERFAFDFTGPKGDSDWIGVAPVGSEAGAHLDGLYVYASDSARHMHAPLKAGRYEVRYVQEGAGGHKVLASRPLQVDPPKASIDAPARAKAGGEVTVRWTGPKTPNDYIALAPANAPIDQYVTYGSIGEANEGPVPTPEQRGRYELRYIAQHSGETLILARRPIAID